MSRPDPTEAISLREDPSRIPNPSHRHAAPSAPWPWVDLSDGELDLQPSQTSPRSYNCLIFFTGVDPQQLTSELPPVPELCSHADCGDECWKNYPKSRFPNWTKRQVKKSKILKAVEEYNPNQECKLYYVDVDDRGRFSNVKDTVIGEKDLHQNWRFFVDNEVSRTNLVTLALLIAV